MSNKNIQAAVEVSKSIYWSRNRTVFMQFVEEETDKDIKLLNNKRRIPKNVIIPRRAGTGIIILQLLAS